MAYNKPAVQVYQELISSGGAASISPDLPACIVGPLRHIVDADLSDSISAADSLAGTLTEWVDADLPLPSTKPGQVATVEDVSDVILSNALVVAWEEDVVESTSVSGNAITLSSNSRGTVTSNGMSQPLPFSADRNHVELGDYIGLAPSGGSESDITVYTQVLSVDYTTGTILVNPSDAPTTDVTVFVFKEFSQITPGTVDVDLFDLGNGTLEVTLHVGPTASTYPMESIAGDSSDYTFSVEASKPGGSTAMNVYIGYSAKRSDMINTIVEIADTTDLENKFGNITKDNPLAFGVSVALANSGGAPVYAISTDPDASLSEDQAYTKALELAEGRRLYWMVPLTTSTSVAGILKAHINSMSLPESGKWRVGLTNFAIPDELYILGRPDTTDGDGDSIEDGMIKATVQSVSGSTVNLTITSGDMVGNTTAGDTVWLDDATPGDNTYLEAGLVESAQGFTIIYKDNGEGNIPSAGDDVSFYVGREATKTDQADAVAGQCKALNDKRMLVFPGEAYFPGATTSDDLLDGYFLMCAVAGMGSGFPAQTGFTNITLGGVSDLVHSNFYFSESQLNSMAEFGAFLYVQNAQGTTPYCRHGLTTDVSVLEYREILKVKNWDYLSYYFKDVLSPFIGTWNITPDTLQTIRQTVTSSAETLLGRKLPKVGPPLLSYNISRLEQNANSSDAIDIDIQVAIVSPNNYTNVYLQI
ncbi:hypothetical protein VPHD69_0281 [Vibrio phage D69]